MPVHKSPVIVLQCIDWSESSQVVHILSREAGLIRALAKGSRRGLNPFSGPLDRWVLGDAVFSLTDPNRLSTLMELAETRRFEGLRRHLPAFYAASMVTELVLAMVPEADRQPDVFDLVSETLSLLSEADPDACRALAFAFALRLLAILGYGADMTVCVGCGEAMDAQRPMDYSAGMGGPVCPQCRPQGAGRIHHLTGKAAQAMSFLVAATWPEVCRVRLSDATADQVRAVLGARVAELAGKQPAALRYV